MDQLPNIVYEALYQEKPGHHKRLYLPVKVILGTGRKLAVPAGFVSDLATVPRLFWGIISPSGRHDLAVLVHDYLLENGWDRIEADKELYYFLRLSQVHPIKCILMYGCVRLYGFIKSK